MADLSQGLLGGSINDLLAYIDARKKVLAQNVGGLLGMGGKDQTPTDTANGLLGDLAGRAKDQMAAAKGTQSVFPEIRDQAQQEMLNGLLNAGGLMAAPTVYHGTPHTFDKFDLSKIGTGEGAQAYGHGMYFAEQPEVANSYRRTNFDFGPIAPPDIAEDLNLTLQDMRKKYHAGGATYAPTPDDAIQKIVSDLDAKMKVAAKSGDFETYTKAADQRLAASRLTQAAKDNPGFLLKQTLPDSVLPKMLQWDKPLSEQPAPVKKAIADYVPAKNKTGQPWDGWQNMTGGDLVNSSPDIADVLARRGIPGLSYLDAGSRAGGKGTMNHVIWDQGLLDQMIPTPVR